MNKKELTQKIVEIDQNLKTLGDLNTLVQNVSSQKQIMDTLVVQLQAQKINIDAIPIKKQELEDLVEEAITLKEDTTKQQNLSEEIKQTVDTLKNKTDEIHNLSLQQLGRISNEKLSNSFDKVKENLKEDNKKWFKWLLGTSIALILCVTVIVFWQTISGDTIFEISFLVKLALTSPIIFFEFFVNREYTRSQRLIEEYEFKASIARSLEAYKEIIENLFADKLDDEYKKKLNFILESIGQLYSSPMKNIKDNETKNNQIDKKVNPALSDIKNIVSDVKNIVSKV